MDRNATAALHVINAGAVIPVAVATQRQPAIERTGEMHGVEMRQDEDAVASGRIPRAHAGNHDVAEAWLTGNTLDTGSD